MHSAPAEPLRIAAPSSPRRSPLPAPPPGEACPPLHENFIARPRLIDALLEDREASLVLLCAPAGYGKTSVLSEWADRDSRPFAWLELREEHNDRRRLLSSLALAAEQLQSVDPLGGNAVRLVGEAVVGGLLETLRSSEEGKVLVLDDVQAVHSREALGVLAQLAGAIPPGAKLVLSSRTKPVLALARLRARHELLAWGVRELAMTAPEAAELLTDAGVELTSDQLDRAMELTEGWPAALYLAAVAARETDDPAGALTRFAEDELVSQYVREEVLGHLRAGMIPFLTDTSILDELSPELCDVILGRSGSGVTLRAVAERNLLVRPLDSRHRRYRCHPLLQRVLRAELSRVAPARARQRHRSAARWFGQNGHVQLALGHALRGADPAYAGELLWAQAPCTLFHRGDPELQSQLEAIDAEQAASVGALALLMAHRGLFTGELHDAARWAHLASGAKQREATLERTPGFEAGMAVVEAAVEQDDIERMSAAAARGRELAEPGGPWHLASSLLGGVALQLLQGDRAEARQLLSEGTRPSAIAYGGLQSHCMSQLAMMAGEEGDWETASDLAERAAAALERARLCDQPTSALVVGVSAWVCAQQGRIDEAKRDLGRSLRMLSALEDFMPWYEVEVRVLVARTAIRLADIDLARTQLTRASRIARRMPAVKLFRTWFDEAWGEIDGLSVAALGGPSSLTMAELRILRFLPTHLSFREIGSRLHVSTNTVKSQVHAVYRKLDAGSRSEAVEHACRLGLIDGGI